MKSNHTKGPWRISEKREKRFPTVYIPYETSLGSGEDTTIVHSQNADADGLLMSLSPDMFEALELAHKFLDSLPEGWLGRTSGDIGALNQFFLKSNAIKRKLEGE